MKIHLIKSILLMSAVMLFVPLAMSAQMLDLKKAEILASPSIKSPVRETAIRVLQEEVEKRTSLTLRLYTGKGKAPLIILAKTDDQEISGIAVPKRTGSLLPETHSEGYRILKDPGGREILWMICADERGVIFSIGEFLRTAELSSKKISFSTANEIATSPAYPIRGHQIGYRNTANSWDAWSVAQYEQYIRDLALFGSNCIENIPFQDGPQGPNMKVPREEMNSRMSEICNNYGLDYWVWTPADADLSDSVKFRDEVRKHSDFYRHGPRLDGVFFPGGDPGDNHPKYVMPFLEAVAGELRKYHPAAGMWISLQGFSEEQIDYFYEYLEK